MLTVTITTKLVDRITKKMFSVSKNGRLHVILNTNENIVTCYEMLQKQY